MTWSFFRPLKNTFSIPNCIFSKICYPIIVSDYFRSISNIKESEPRFPADPNSAKHIWIHGLVKQTVHLLLHRQACKWKPCTNIVLRRPQGHRLHPLEGRVLLKAQLQLLTEQNKATFNHTHVQFK